jgi:hypothetical protein
MVGLNVSVEAVSPAPVSKNAYSKHGSPNNAWSQSSAEHALGRASKETRCTCCLAGGSRGPPTASWHCTDRGIWTQ